MLDVKDTKDFTIKELSGEEKICEQNCIRQLAFRAHKNMPKDFNSFCRVAEHLVKNAYRYYNIPESDELKEEAVTPVNKIVKKSTVESSCQSGNKLLHTIRSLTRQIRIQEQQVLVKMLKSEVGSYRDLSRVTGTPLKTVHEWCSEPKERSHKGSS